MTKAKSNKSIVTPPDVTSKSSESIVVGREPEETETITDYPVALGPEPPAKEFEPTLLEKLISLLP